MTPVPFAFTPFPPPFGLPQSRNVGTEGAISPDTNPFGSIGVPNPAGTPPPDPSNPFPTLVPEGISTTPAISSFIEEKSINVEGKPFIGSNGAVDGEIRAGEISKKGKKKGVLTPPSMPGVAPDELVELVDYAEYESSFEGPQPDTAPVASTGREGSNSWTPVPPEGEKVNSWTSAPSLEEVNPWTSTPPLEEINSWTPVPPVGGEPNPWTPVPPVGGEPDSWTPSAISVHKVGPVTAYPEDNVDDRTTIPIKDVSGSGIGKWRFVVKPSGYDGPNLEPVEVPPSEITQEYKAKGERTVAVVSETDEFGSNRNSKIENRTNSIFTNKVGEIIGSFFTNKTAFSQSIVKSGISSSGFIPETSTVTPRRTTTPGDPVLIQTVTESPPCGVPPHFTPCVSSLEASKKLLECCKRRLMPPGCLELCRYDVTQSEIKAAFDAGKCGILNVAPFLECASNGNNNLECCRYRGISQKSGPQCEVFCNPAGGLGSLGLQHLVCQKVIGDLLQCHHSGIRR